MSGRSVEIHYRRLPDHETVFRQPVVVETPECIVTLVEETPIQVPVAVGGRVVLEPGAPAVWFTYPGRWYDVGRFHLKDGTFTGLYANLLTPVRIQGDTWETTDLCLDVWVGADGTVAILDDDELATAERAGWIHAEEAAEVRARARWLAEDVEAGRWPPHEVQEWPLARARDHLRGSAAASPSTPGNDG